MVRIGNRFVRTGEIKLIDLEKNAALGYQGQVWPFAFSDDPQAVVKAIEQDERDGSARLCSARIGTAQA
jgi:hypothetical protein